MIEYDMIHFIVPVGKFVSDSNTAHMAHDISSYHKAAPLVTIIKNNI